MANEIAEQLAKTYEFFRIVPKGDFGNILMELSQAISNAQNNLNTSEQYLQIGRNRYDLRNPDTRKDIQNKLAETESVYSNLVQYLDQKAEEPHYLAKMVWLINHSGNPEMAADCKAIAGEVTTWLRPQSEEYSWRLAKIADGIVKKNAQSPQPAKQSDAADQQPNSTRTPQQSTAASGRVASAGNSTELGDIIRTFTASSTDTTDRHSTLKKIGQGALSAGVGLAAGAAYLGKQSFNLGRKGINRLRQKRAARRAAASGVTGGSAMGSPAQAPASGQNNPGHSNHVDNRFTVNVPHGNGTGSGRTPAANAATKRSWLGTVSQGALLIGSGVMGVLILQNPWQAQSTGQLFSDAAFAGLGMLVGEKILMPWFFAPMRTKLISAVSAVAALALVQMYTEKKAPEWNPSNVLSTAVTNIFYKNGPPFLSDTGKFISDKIGWLKDQFPHSEADPNTPTSANRAACMVEVYKTTNEGIVTDTEKRDVKDLIAVPDPRSGDYIEVNGPSRTGARQTYWTDKAKFDAARNKPSCG